MTDLALGAVIAFDFETWNVRDEIALLHEVGIRRVQIYRNYVQGITARKVRETLDSSGLVIDSLHGYFYSAKFPGPMCDLSSPEASVRQASLEIMRGEADFARTLACRDVIVHPSAEGSVHGDPRRGAALADAAQALAQLGRQQGIRFLVENMPPPMFGDDAPPLRQIVDDLDDAHVGLAYDTGHAMLAGDPVGIIRTMGPRLGAVHLHDNRGREDDHLIPGTGVAPFEDIARALAEVGFAGTFMLEVYQTTAEVRRDLTPARRAFIERLRRLASGRDA